jgi:hypothetical protein
LKTENNTAFVFLEKPNQAWFFLSQVKKGESGNQFLCESKDGESNKHSSTFSAEFESAGIAQLRKQEVIMTNVILRESLLGGNGAEGRRRM